MSFSLQAARRILLVALALVMTASLAFAQGGSQTSTLTGTVTDAQGAVIPGADVDRQEQRHQRHRPRPSATRRANSWWRACPPGTYTLTVSLMGFKTFVSPDVKMLAGTPESIKVTLQVGALEETVLVTGATEIVQTQSATVQTTLQVKQLQQMPLATHTALDYIVSLPGVNTSGSGNSRARPRSTTCRTGP